MRKLSDRELNDRSKALYSAMIASIGINNAKRLIVAVGKLLVEEKKRRKGK